MAKRSTPRKGHTGKTESGNTRDVKIERIGPVTIYKRGETYSLYYRENGKSERRRIDDNLLVARSTAAKVAAAIGEKRPSPLGFDRTSPEKMTLGYLDFVAHVQLPLTAAMKKTFEQLIDGRPAGFVFRNYEWVEGNRKSPNHFASDSAFRARLLKIAQDTTHEDPAKLPKPQRKAVTSFCRQMGQIPVKRIQHEFCELTQAIGCPHFTRTHDLRHLFSSRAQEKGTNPLLVQEILGHATMTMTKHYTHLGMEMKRDALKRLTESGKPVDESTQKG